jgi:hypothetical protein
MCTLHREPQVTDQNGIFLFSITAKCNYVTVLSNTEVSKTILNTNGTIRLMTDDTMAYISKHDASVQPLQNSENLQNRTTGRNGNMK